jgi:hypothetical protein
MTAKLKRWETLKAKLKEITRKTSPMSFDQYMQKLKEANLVGKLVPIIHQ